MAQITDKTKKAGGHFQVAARSLETGMLFQDGQVTSRTS
jgi:hypothetical protein